MGYSTIVPQALPARGGSQVTGAWARAPQPRPSMDCAWLQWALGWRTAAQGAGRQGTSHCHSAVTQATDLQSWVRVRASAGAEPSTCQHHSAVLVPLLPSRHRFRRHPETDGASHTLEQCRDIVIVVQVAEQVPWSFGSFRILKERAAREPREEFGFFKLVDYGYNDPG